MPILSGAWQIALDPRNEEREQHWYDQAGPEAVAAPVPGLIQDVFPNYHGVAWYWHRFPPDLTGLRNPSTGSGQALSGLQRLLLCFGAVDYLGEVWLNGQYVGCYEGGETPFEFDVTEAVRLDADNLLAVRVLNPADTPIDGYVLKEVPHSNRTNSTRAGSSTNMGGIPYPVTLRRVPAIYVADLFVRPDLHTDRIAVTVTVRNNQDAVVPGALTLSVAPDQVGEIIASVEQAVELPAGLSEHELTVQVAQPRPWDLEDPCLYRVTAEVGVEGSSAHQHSVRCGFRELRVIDGYFTLNGRRIFLKSAHTGRGMRSRHAQYQ
ncbi:MAG: sugar-binding domain-containing protein, partial [Actinomycetes bacterium]